MTKPNDKREWWLIFEKGYSSWISDKPLFSADCEEIHVVAMADVQPLVDAVGEFLKLNEAIKTDPHNVGDEWENSIERLEAALEKWNGK